MGSSLKGIAWGIACLVLFAGSAYGRNFGVVIGIADYPPGINDLKYTDDDAVAVWNALVGDPGWAAEDLILLLDAAATKADVFASIATLGAQMSGGDTLFFYFAGHGTVGSDLPPLDEEDGMDEYLCLYGTTVDQFLRDDELAALFAPCGDGRIVAVLDTCYSGGQLGAVRSLNTGPGPAEGDGFTEDLMRDARATEVTPKDLVDLTQPFVALAACGEREFSWEFGPPRNHGLFTFYFLEGLRGTADAEGDRDGRVAAEECFSYLVPRVGNVSDSWGLNQHPEILDLFPGTADLVQSQSPQAAFAVEQARAEAPAECAFDPSESTAASGHALRSFRWDFGDGASTVQTGPTKVSHTYTTDLARDEFEVVLTVEDDVGVLDSSRATLVVTNCQPVTGFEWRASGDPQPWGCGDIVADATGSPSLAIDLRSLPPEREAVGGVDMPLPCETVPANYANHNLSYDPEGQGVSGDGWGIVRYEIDFGDGTQLSLPADPLDGHLDALLHRYSELPLGVSSYTVSLKAFDELGGTGTWTRTLTIRRDGDSYQELCLNLDGPAWHMIALPGEICGVCQGAGDLCCGLCDDLDPCLLYRYDTARGRYDAFPPCGTGRYAVGTGLWVYASEPAQVCLTVTVPTEAVRVQLQVGWNQVGNPFGFRVQLSDVFVRYQGTEVTLESAEQSGWVRMYLFGYDRTSHGYTMIMPPSGELEPLTGYWILSYVECELSISPLPASAETSPSALAADPVKWREMGLTSPPLPPPLNTRGGLVETLEVIVEPNPVRNGEELRVSLSGPGSERIEAIRFDVYDLSGRLVWRQDAQARASSWTMRDLDGEFVANGIYLCSVCVKIGDAWYPLEVQKLAVLR